MDNFIMPHGKYKGHKMKDIPDGYLQWMFDNDKLRKDLRPYVQHRIGMLRSEKEQEEIASKILSLIIGKAGGIGNVTKLDKDGDLVLIETMDGSHYSLQISVTKHPHKKDPAHEPK